MLLSATYLLAHTRSRPRRRSAAAIQGNICRCTGYVNIVKSIQARRSEAREPRPTTVAASQVELEVGYAGKSIPRKEDRRLVQGQGVFADDVKRHGMGYVHFVRAPYAHARIVSVDVSQAEALEGVYGTLTPDEVAELTDPFFELTTPPGSQIKDYALAVGRVRHIGEPVVAVVAATRELARDAADLVEVEYEPLDVLVDARRAAGRRRAGPPRRRRHERRLVGHVRLGRRRRRAEGRRPRREDQGAPLRPLLLDAARVLGGARRVRPRHRPVHDPLQPPDARASPRSGWARRCASRSTSSASSRRTSAAASATRSRRTSQLTACCLLARKLKRPIQWTEWRTDQHTANAHGNERWFHDIEVAVQNDGTMLGFKVKALDDCGAFPRYEPLGCIIWAQVTPGLYRWRNIRVDFTQVVTNKSPVAPNRGYSRMQQLWLTERICDIVAHELGLDPVEVRKKNYVKTEEMPYETPNGCVYDSGDYARCLDIALELIDYERRARAAGRSSNGKLHRDRDRLDARLRHEQLRPVDAPQPGAPVLGEQRGGDDQARHLRRDRRSRSARSRRARATRRSPRRSPATSSASRPTRSTCGPGHDSYWNSHAGFSGTYASQFAVTGLEAVKGAAEKLVARDPPARRRRARRRRPGRHRARGRLREAQGQPGGGAAVHGLRRDRQREQRGAAARAARHHAQLPPRLRAAVHDARLRAQVRQPDADLRDADPRVRRRDRPGDGRRRDRSTTRPWTTAGSGSTRRSSRARCTARPRTRSAPPCTRRSPTTSTASC